MKAENANACNLDIDIGYIKKSPCRECPNRSRLPECAENCNTISQLQKLLAGSISCSNTFSELEAYTLSQQNS
jgi:hypothetical protein